MGSLGFARRIVISALGAFVFVVLVPLFIAYLSAFMDSGLELPKLSFFPLNVLLGIVLAFFGLFFMA